MLNRILNNRYALARIMHVVRKQPTPRHFYIG
jgi:hypothetical protein